MHVVVLTLTDTKEFQNLWQKPVKIILHTLFRCNEHYNQVYIKQPPPPTA
jgi:hypothetical protein